MTHTALSDAALAQAWIDSCIALKAIEHVGAHNRFVTTVVALEKEMLARCGGRPDLFEPILSNEDPAVRMAASYQFREAKPELFRAVMTELSSQPGEIGQDARYALATMDAPTPISEKSEAPRYSHTYWQANNPPTPAMTRDEIEQRLRAIAPDCCDQLMSFARPAIGLWPQRPRADLPVTASKLGGMPYAPRGFEWPVAATEPMLFLGQINCTDLKGFPGAEQLPSQGLLSMFGDHDTVNGCMFTAEGGALFYWPDVSDLVPAVPPLEPSQVFKVCELAFRAVIDMPHPDSTIMQDIFTERSAYESYREFYQALKTFGVPEDDAMASFGKILGWPDLVQGDDLDFFLDDAETDSPFRLLIQIEDYSTGDGIEGYGPGGSLYFMITEHDFAEGDFEAAQLTSQCT